MDWRYWRWNWRYELIERRREKVVHAIVWHLPHWLIYWSAIRAGANATTGEFGNEHPDETSVMDVIKRWGDRIGGDPAFRRRAS